MLQKDDIMQTKASISKKIFMEQNYTITLNVLLITHEK